jgi:hypothetical protein
MHQVKIVIPIYKNELSELEKKSLKQVFKVLGAYPITIIKPFSLTITSLNNYLSKVEVLNFANEYFSGIPGYNRLMLSEEFYETFADCRYILIYQLDAYVFSDCLSEWCSKDYDYIGAPWLRRPIYNLPLIKQWINIKHFINKKKGKLTKQDLYNKVGNGGLSLRKVESHLRVLREQRNQVNEFANHKHYHLFNEDVFWATQPKNFHYPTAMEAIQFSFDKYPAYCYRLNKKKLPFGCHAWYKRKMRSFWKNIIGF